MEVAKIHYAVLALTNKTVDEAIFYLKEQKGNNDVINWLQKQSEDGKNQKNQSRYGNLPENWKPFGGVEEIREIIEQNSQDYHPETQLISSIIDGNSEELDLSIIDVFFIDPFSMYLPEIEKLANRSDQAFCSARDHKCCFLLDYNLPHNIQYEMEKVLYKSWKLVSSRYRAGCLHRVAARIDDVNNFRNYLINISDKPDSKTKANFGKTLFKNCPEKPVPNFLRERGK